MQNKQDIENLPDDHPIKKALKNLANDIRLLIELSLHDDYSAWEKWLPEIVEGSPIRCWEIKKCSKSDCPAFQNTKVRCWLAAGTMCEGKTRGEFALKYKSCTECDVYQTAVYANPVVEIYEHLITLVHSLKGTQDKLRTLAMRDFLTGLYNRNYFNETMAREIEYAKRNNQDIHIIMVDIDNFKQINDTYGHLHGDGVLKECAAILTKATRKSDVVCRFGGDEFLIITSMASEDNGSAEIVSRIQQYVEEWNNEFATADYELVVSMGCSTLAEDGHLLEALQEADRLMYEEKKKKREQTIDL